MMRVCSFFCAALLLAPSLLAPSAAPRVYRYQEPSVLYTIQGQIDFTRRAIDATVEIEYLNDSDSTVSPIWLQLPDKIDHEGKGKHFTLDSILLNGVPQRIESILVGKWYLMVPAIVPPQERIHLLVPFHLTLAKGQMLNRNDGITLIDDWYPRVITDPLVADGSRHSVISPTPLIASYRVGLKADPALRLVGAGEVRNDRELFGILPDRGDTILHDILNNPLAGVPPVHKGEYLWQARSLQNFEVAALSNPIISRVTTGQAELTMYFSGQARRHHRLLGTLAQQLSRFYQDKLGVPPNPQTSVVAADLSRGSRPRDERGLIILETESRKQDVMIASLAVQLAQQYFTPSIASDSADRLPWPDGAAMFAASQALYAVLGPKGYDMIEAYGDYRFPRSRAGRPIGRHSPFAWIDMVRAPRIQWSAEDSLRYEKLFVVPSALYSLQRLVGADQVWSALAQYSNDSRHSLTSPNRFVVSMVEYLNGAVDEDMLGQWKEYGRRWDFSVDHITVESTYTGALVAGSIERDALRKSPIGVGIVMSTGDTLVRNVTPPETDTSKYVRFSFEIVGRPIALIVDPYHFLPDGNRDNNVYRFGRNQFRFRPKADEFPAFRRLVRSE